jgi:hypothetical protein
MAELDGNVAEINILSAESLTDIAFTDGTDWTGANDFTNPPAGDAEYIYSAGNGTMTQDNADMAVVGVASRQYRAKYTVAVSVALNPATALTITNAFANTATVLTPTAGTNYTYFTSSSGAAAADFVIDVTGASAGSITLDDFSLRRAENVQWVTADWTEGKDITEVPPDSATNGKKLIDPDVYSGTLSLTINYGAVTYSNSFQDQLETAYAAGTSLTLEIKRSSANDYKDEASFKVVSKSEPKGIVGVQQVTYELRTTGDITRTRP